MGEVAALLAKRHRAVLGKGCGVMVGGDLACNGLLLDIVPIFIGRN